jgi:hypothetical protein
MLGSHAESVSLMVSLVFRRPLTDKLAVRYQEEIAESRIPAHSIQTLLF